MAYDSNDNYINVSLLLDLRLWSLYEITKVGVCGVSIHLLWARIIVKFSEWNCLKKTIFFASAVIYKGSLQWFWMCISSECRGRGMWCDLLSGSSTCAHNLRLEDVAQSSTSYSPPRGPISCVTLVDSVYCRNEVQSCSTHVKKCSLSHLKSRSAELCQFRRAIKPLFHFC